MKPHSTLILILAIALATANASLRAGEIRPLTPEQRKEYEQLSPFEFKNMLIDAAEASGKHVCNAGRGNPNFVNTRVRYAFAMLHRFAADRARAVKTEGDLGFPPVSSKGAAAAFEKFLAAQDDRATADFLTACMEHARKKLKIETDIFVADMADAILGDHYPTPSRMLKTPEAVVEEYLKMLHFPSNRIPDATFDLFTTEGATAAMIYVFNTLKENFILLPGDKIAIITPIFSPYIEIPVLNDYKLLPIYVKGSETEGWHVPAAEIEKLRDTSIKALFMVNPMNPGAVSMGKAGVDAMADLIRKERKDLIVLTDTVYVPFVNEFHDLVQQVPENCIGVFSFSKYVGVTGWRLGVIFVQRTNVLDAKIQALPDDKKARLRKRYETVSDDPDAIAFIDRLLIDSRSVALAHTGGLSTPQQCIMTLFSFYDLMDTDKVYKKSIQTLLQRRMGLLYAPLKLSPPAGKDQTFYYTLINMRDLAEKLHGAEFAAHLTKNYSPFDLLLHLANSYGAVLLPGEGFAGPEWSARVSLANLADEDYSTIGNNLVATINDYYAAWKGSKQSKP